MMNKWFECKVKYVKTMENGLEKPVTETYLVDALSFTEAEKRFLEEIRPFMSGEFEVTGIKPVKFSDVYYCDLESADKWFKCKITMVTIDEVSAKEKKSSVVILVKAEDVTNAVKNLNKHMEDSIMDYNLASVNESPIVDIFHYEA